MSFLTSHMEAMLAAATDPEEIELRRTVLEDHRAHQKTSPGDLAAIPVDASISDHADLPDGARA